jgi:antitoxin HicB
MDKTVEYYMNLPYTIEMRQEPEGGWFVRVKELRGCMSDGDTPEEAATMIQEAMELWLEVALEDGVPIPEPRPESDYSGKFVVRVPRSLHRELVETAEQEGVSLNQYINVTLAQSIGRPASLPPSETEEPSWPGVKPAVQQALTAAGLTAEAGELDEQLFANWAEGIIDQVANSLQEGSLQEALIGLQILARALKAGAGKSPVMDTLYRMIHLLDQQIESQVRHQRGEMDARTLDARIARLAELANKELAIPTIQEERVAYSQTTASEMSLQPSQPAKSLVGA